MQWNAVDFNGLLWFGGLLWIAMDCDGSLRIAMDGYGFLWSAMDRYGLLWIPTDCYGIAMQCYGLLWGCAASNALEPTDSYTQTPACTRPAVLKRAFLNIRTHLTARSDQTKMDCYGLRLIGMD